VKEDYSKAEKTGKGRALSRGGKRRASEREKAGIVAEEEGVVSKKRKDPPYRVPLEKNVPG